MLDPEFKVVILNLKLKFMSSFNVHCKLKITNILKSTEWGLEKSEFPWEHNFYSCRCVSCRTISLPSFNGMCCKLTQIALLIYLI